MLRFWNHLQESLRTKLRYSTAFNPQSDGQSKRVIQFTYNNSHHASLGMSPFKALYRRRCKSPICWMEHSERKMVGPDLKAYAELKRKEISFEVGDKVFLKVSPWKKVIRFDQKGKLSPRFIGLYEVVEQVSLVVYRLELPLELSNIHNVFYVSMFRRYQSKTK
ncbi:DNA/RNA polymerases superfamily protein [Gossypium australe]|uniref:DNA/RNA polymerases superfamily protein n=1 Tax=Gossypium australe TaxID=47621 RepID=A0A5B6WUB2_9ROSI|nr:DNA/RNA polymerases superfamily protein [Gossypium australe]